MHACLECRNWQKCPIPTEWFPPVAIRFCPNHISWLLENIELLEAGRWPRDPEESGYTGGSVKQHYQHAYFETPIQMIAEVTVRLERCGKDGALARASIGYRYDLMTLALLMNTTIDRLERRITRVVKYCSGWRRRQVTYNEFVQRRRQPAKRRFAGS